MTNAEFKTYSETLGLHSSWWSDTLGVNIRTIDYWMMGRPSKKVEVPKDAIDTLESINNWAESCANQAVEFVKSLSDIPDEITLLRYRSNADLWHFKRDLFAAKIPATAHAQMAWRTKLKLDEIGIKSKIVWFNVEQYLDWLDGRKDDESLRAEWAIRQQ